jgi:hypothetical protein
MFVIYLRIPVSNTISYQMIFASFNIARRVSYVEQELLPLPEHLSSHPVLVGFMLLDLWFSL